MSGRIVSLVVLFLAPSTTVWAQAQPPAASASHECEIDLERVGQMEDILSNALTRGLEQEESRVRAYLTEARRDCANGPELLRKTAAEFGLREADLAAEVERWRHVNCEVQIDSGAPLSLFATDVTLHVILHELGHSLIREFDLPVLGNEETVADAFATHYLTTHLPERALDVLGARVAALMFEANAVPRAEWSVSGEHDSDARRAFQIAALAVAADPETYRPVALEVGMSDDDIRACADYGAEIHRSWRRILQPLWMPAGVASSEARVVHDSEGGFVGELRSSGLMAELEAALRRFDWHSQVTIRFTEGDGGAAWNRSQRTITVHSGYVRRFIEQGESMGRAGAPAHMQGTRFRCDLRTRGLRPAPELCAAPLLR
jgi:hypothetical protein